MDGQVFPQQLNYEVVEEKAVGFLSQVKNEAPLPVLGDHHEVNDKEVEYY